VQRRQWGKVPALEDGAVRIWDSGAICAYLADQYPRCEASRRPSAARIVARILCG
jgi:glutathione S-transferase